MSSENTLDDSNATAVDIREVPSVNVKGQKRQNSLVQSLIAEKSPELLCEEEPIFHDFSEFIKCALTRQASRERLISSLQSSDPEENEYILSFLETSIQLFEPRIEGETCEEFEIRYRETINELRSSLANWSVSGFLELDKFLIQNFRDGEKFFREKNFRQAIFAFSNAAFAAQAIELTEEFCIEFVEEFDVALPDSFPGTEIPHGLIFLQCKMKLIECLLMDQQYKKVAIYSNHLLHWMTTREEKKIIGFFAEHFTEKFSLAQIWMGEAEVALCDPVRAIDLNNLAIEKFCRLPILKTLDQSIFSVRKTFLERLADFFESDEEPIENVQRDRESAKIIVDAEATRGVSNGQFTVNDLDSALRIAKNGDVIFFEEGTFVGRTLRQQSGRKKVVIEINKSVTLVGSSPKKSRIYGSIVKLGPGDVCFRRLKLVIGEDCDSDEDVYLLEGQTLIENCVVECAVNTGMYVLSKDSETLITIRHSIIDGMESCKRFITLQGSQPALIVESCHICDMYSFCTVITPDCKSNAFVSVANSVIYDVQDGLKLIVHPSSDLRCTITGCHFELVLYEQEVSSHAVELSAGSIVCRNNLVFSNHIDPIGFSLRNLKSVEMKMFLIETTQDLTRSFSIGQGVILCDVQHAVVDRVELCGLRCALQVTFTHVETQLQKISLSNCNVRSCSLGLSVQDDFDSSRARQNSRVEVTGCTFDTSHYGVMNRSPHSRVRVEGCSFFDVPKPILIYKLCAEGALLKSNSYRLSDIFTCEADQGTKSILEKMFLHFASEENLPHRIAYISQDYFLVNSVGNEIHFSPK